MSQEKEKIGISETEVSYVAERRTIRVTSGLVGHR
jgi:hypothetical protein